MKINASAISHPGNCREKNEDNFCLNGKKLVGNLTVRPIKYRGETTTAILMGVFDGMGGIKAGERASAIVADTACSAIVNVKDTIQPDSFMIDICKQANALVCSEMFNLNLRMGSTASMLCFQDSTYYLCNIGDSPIYIYRDNELTRIFHEHTEKENFLKIYGNDAILPKKKFKLTQNIGVFPDEMEIEPFLTSSEIKKQDRFLIASDGLTDMVDEMEIKEILSKKMSCTKTVKKLLQRALNNGGKDNVTIICIDLH